MRREGPTHFGRYRLLERIGEGGMGVVYKAWDTQLERIVALKGRQVVSGAPQGDRRGIERFLREARAAAALKHPNIVAVHDVGQLGDQYYLTMDFIEGRTYADYLEPTRQARREGRGEAYRELRGELGWLAQVAHAIQHAHEQRLIHRDLKPSNIIIDTRSQPYVTDFGLAKEVRVEEAVDASARRRTLTFSGELLGTPGYMSPEQAEGKVHAIGPWTDVYALGVILYETLTGRLPFGGEREGSGRSSDRTTQRGEATTKRPGLFRMPRQARHRFWESGLRIILQAFSDIRNAQSEIGKEPGRRLPRNLRRKPRFRGTVAQRRGGGGSLVEILHRVIHEEPSAPRRCNPLAPRELETICLKCLEKEPARRYEGAGELGKDLDRWLCGEPIQARRPPAWYRLAKWVAKRKAAAAVAFLAIAAAVVVTLVVRHGSRRLQQKEQEVGELQAKIEDIRSTSLYHEADKLLSGGLLLRRKAGDTSELERGAGEVLRLAEEALALNPGNVEAHFLKGWVLRLSGKWEGAIRQYDEVLKRSDRQPIALYERSLAYLALYGAARQEALRSWRQLHMQAAAAAEGLSSAERSVSVRVPDPTEADLRKLRPELEAYGGRAAEDLRRMQEHPIEVEGMVECARGLAELAHQRYEEALGCFEKAVQQDEEIDEAWEGLARALYGLWEKGARSTEEALATLARAIESNRGLDVLYRIRSGLTGHRASILYWQQGSEEAFELWKKADEDATRAVANWPHGGIDLAQRAEVRSNWGKALQDRGAAEAGERFAQAIADAEEAVRREPEDVETYRFRGAVRWRYGWWKARRGEDPTAQFAGAMEDAGEILRRIPGCAVAYYYRGQARTALGEWKASRGEEPVPHYEAAIQDCEEALARNPELVNAYLQRAAVRQRWGEWKAIRGRNPVAQYESALQDYEEALRRNPELGEAYNDRGVARFGLAEWKMTRGEESIAEYRGAVQDFTEALRRKKGDAGTYGNRGASRMRIGNWKMSRGEDPSDEYGAAIGDLEVALRENPESVDAYNSRAISRKKLGDWRAQQGEDPAEQYEGAIQDYGEALKRNPGFWIARANRGMLYETMGRLEEALAEYEEAYRSSGDPRVKAMIDRVRAALGEGNE